MMEQTPEQLRAYRLQHWEDAIRYAILDADPKDIPRIAAETVNQCIQDGVNHAKEAMAFAASLSAMRPEQP